MLDSVKLRDQPNPHIPRGLKFPEQAGEDFTLTEEEITRPKYDPLEAGLPGYIRQYGISIDDLQPHQVAMFVAARNLEPIIQNLKIPVATRPIPSNEKIIIEREIEKDLEKTRYTEEERSVEVPADRMDVSLIDDPQEISRILPSQWVTEEIAPAVFLKRLANRELLRADWREPWQKPETYTEKVKVREKFEQPVPPKIEKQHACVVMDISGSMAQQGRSIVAAGLGLAFLKQGHENRAKLMYRGFGGSPDTPIVGTTEEDFTNICQTIISQSFNRDDTDIQRALEDTAGLIQRDGKFAQADIMLVTDGLSMLETNPLGKVKLHTFIVNPKNFLDLPDQLKTMLGTLRQWSKTFKYIATNDYEMLRPPPISRKELDELDAASKAIPEEMVHITDPEELKRARERLSSLMRYMSNAGCENRDRKILNQVMTALRTELAKLSDGETEVLERNKAIIEEERREAERQRLLAERARAESAARALKDLRRELAEKEPDDEVKNKASFWERVREFMAELKSGIDRRFKGGGQTSVRSSANDAEPDRPPYLMRPHF